MKTVSFILPFIFALVFMVTTDYEALWWVYLIMLVVTELILLILCSIMKDSTGREFISGYIISVVHYNAWVEKVQKTKTEYDKNGNSHTVTYYEYVEHPEYWSAWFNTNNKLHISEYFFYEICQLFGTHVYSFNTNYANCVSGGGGQACDWDGDEWHTKTATFSQGYKNPILNSNSIFKFREISEKEALENELFEYPLISESQEQDVVCCQKDLAESVFDEISHNQSEIQTTFQHLNAFCGKSNQIHVFVLIFDAQKYDVEIAEMQRSYWHGGNKNEFTVCLGVEEKVVKWCHAFSWMDAPTLGVSTKQYFLKKPKLDLIVFADWLRNNLDKWKRKEFKDFEYLGNNLSKENKKTMLITSIILCLISVGLTVLINVIRLHASVYPYPV